MTVNSAIPLALDDVFNAARIGENDDWEFKSAKGGFPASVWETFSAMANSGGGTIVLGAKEKNNKPVLDGIKHEELSKLKTIFWNQHNNRGVISRPLATNSDVQAIQINRRWLLAIRVRQAERRERPIYKGQNPFGGTFVRRHEGDYRCTDEEVRRMFADASETPADSCVLEHFGVADLEKASLDGYRNRFITTKGSGHPWADLDTKEFLRNLGGWCKDRERGVEGPTRAGLLMFGKLQAITSPGVAPKYAVDFRDYRDRKARQRWADRVFSDGTWEANLFQFYQYVWPKLVDQLKVPFVLEGPQRVDNTPVHDALREAIGNAFIHADYTVGGGIVIERHDHRFHFANPGTLLVSHEQLRRGGVSECRNPNLQRMFMMIGVGEQAGSGYAIIREGWKTQHWRTPWISTQDAPERVRLEMPMISLMPERAFDALYTHMGSTFNRLGERERIALVTAFIEGEVSNVRMQDLVDYHPSDITKLLRGLVAKGLLHTDNRRRWTRYSLPAGVAPQTDLFSSQDSSHYGGNSSHYELKSEESATQCEELDKHINEVANKGRVSRETMEAAIRALCAHSPQTLNELATRLNRKPGGLRNHYLTPMVRSGKLALTYPNQPNHPNQSYTTVQTEE